MKSTDSIVRQRLSAEELVELLNLGGHVEGGFFRRTYAADYRLLTPGGDERLSMTSIFYLLAAESPVGHFHLNRSDIVHYFHMGDPITYYLLHPDGELEIVVMGNDLRAGHVLQLTVPGGVWKASQIPSDGEHGFGLISEAVSPGFEYADMTLGYRSRMLAQFPEHRALLVHLSHPAPETL
ncbi:MAG: cupin [Gammaproteobacteria bacterium]|nr:cupin [Gammaproteobacteria bacterium]|tara:strand:- start:57 stop:599 length:543 start_codon:yes stop_codon:yes gene_type:complete